jgi:hypothetical protein
MDPEIEALLDALDKRVLELEQRCEWLERAADEEAKRVGELLMRREGS